MWIMWIMWISFREIIHKTDTIVVNSNGFRLEKISTFFQKDIHN